MRTNMSRLLLATLLCGAPVLSSCAILAVGAVGVIVSQEFIDNAQVAYIQEDSERVWATAKSSQWARLARPVLSPLKDRLLRVLPASRRAFRDAARAIASYFNF